MSTLLAQKVGQPNYFEGSLKDVSTLQLSSVFMSSGTAVGSTDNSILYTWCSIYTAIAKRTAVGKIVAAPEVNISREKVQLRLWAPASQQSQAAEVSVSLKGI